MLINLEVHLILSKDSNPKCKIDSNVLACIINVQKFRKLSYLDRVNVTYKEGIHQQRMYSKVQNEKCLWEFCSFLVWMLLICSYIRDIMNMYLKKCVLYSCSSYYMMQNKRFFKKEIYCPKRMNLITNKELVKYVVYLSLC